MPRSKQGLSTEDFLANLNGRKIRIVPKVRVEVESGETMVIEADCSGCNNANQPMPYTAEPESKRWTD